MSNRTSFFKIWTVSSCKFNANFLTFLSLYHFFFCCRNYWSWSNHHLMANIWEKAISILAGNLNLDRSYLITTVAYYVVSYCGFTWTHKTRWSASRNENRYIICGKNMSPPRQPYWRKCPEGNDILHKRDSFPP